MTEAAFILALLALAISAGSLAISIWQARISARRLTVALAEHTHRQRARLAITPGAIHRSERGWDVEIALTNVGGGNARQIEVWLVDESRSRVSESAQVGVLVAGESDVVTLTVRPHDGDIAHVYAVRSYRDGSGAQEDRSERPIALP